jgi:hypothetical protein
MASQVADYLALLEQAVGKSGDHLGCYSPPDARFLSLETMLNSWKILKKAEKKAGKIFEYQKRIRRIQMAAAYVILVRWDAFRQEAREKNLPWPWPGSRQAFLDWFLQAARSEGATMVSEWQTLEDWAVKGGKSR